MQSEKREVHFVGNCLGCGYSLIHLQENRCPECGRAFDPANPRTMDFHHARWNRFLRRPTTWRTPLPALLLIIAACLTTYTGPIQVAAAFQSIAVIAALTTLWVIIARRRFSRYMRRRNFDEQQK